MIFNDNKIQLLGIFNSFVVFDSIITSSKYYGNIRLLYSLPQNDLNLTGNLYVIAPSRDIHTRNLPSPDHVEPITNNNGIMILSVE